MDTDVNWDTFDAYHDQSDSSSTGRAAKALPRAAAQIIAPTGKSFEVVFSTIAR